MTILYRFFKRLFQPQQTYFFFNLKTRDKKKITIEALRESIKMQKDIIKEYKRKYPTENQQFYKSDYTPISL